MWSFHLITSGCCESQDTTQHMTKPRQILCLLRLRYQASNGLVTYLWVLGPPWQILIIHLCFGVSFCMKWGFYLALCLILCIMTLEAGESLIVSSKKKALQYRTETLLSICVWGEFSKYFGLIIVQYMNKIEYILLIAIVCCNPKWQGILENLQVIHHTYLIHTLHTVNIVNVFDGTQYINQVYARVSIKIITHLIILINLYQMAFEHSKLFAACVT